MSTWGHQGNGLVTVVYFEGSGLPEDIKIKKGNSGEVLLVYTDKLLDIHIYYRSLLKNVRKFCY